HVTVEVLMSFDSGKNNSNNEKSPHKGEGKIDEVRAEPKARQVGDNSKQYHIEQRKWLRNNSTGLFRYPPFDGMHAQVIMSTHTWLPMLPTLGTLYQPAGERVRSTQLSSHFSLREFFGEESFFNQVYFPL